MSVLDATQEPTGKRPTRIPRAVMYLRVSSPSQVRTDYDPEGLSLPSQRERCQQKAKALGAEVVREYVEPGISAKSLINRKAFKKMVDDIRELRDVDVVIVWSVSRWARNQEDHWTARGLINRAGAKLVSVKEPIGENTSYGVMIEGVLAAAAESRRIEISEDVTRGVQRKLEVGGFPGYAPLGYLNVQEPLPQGGVVRTISIDETRAPLIRWGFETYATGLYSINDLTVLLAARGLRTRGNRRYASKRLTQSTVHTLLSNPFYAGKMTYKGKVYKGRHEPIISEELFDKVQAVLEAHNLSGERDRKHQHHLKGTIFCGECGHRLVYSRHKGNGGTYEYFVCPYYHRRACTIGYLRADEIEGAIERHYKTVTLTAEQRERVEHEIEHRLLGLAETSDQERRRCDALLVELTEQERKLLAKHYADEVSETLYAEEADRIKKERIGAEAILDRLTVRHDELRQFLALVLSLVSYDLHDLYLRAQPHIRRLMNQAIFEAIWIEDPENLRSQLASPLKEVHDIATGLDPEAREAVDRVKNKTKPHDAPEPVLVGVGTGNDEASCPGSPETEGFALGSISPSMVGPAGLEPATYRL